MTRSQPEPSSGGAPPGGPRRYAADRDREVGRPRSAAALPPGGTAASPLAELTSWSAKQRRADAALSPCMNRVEKGPLEILALAAGAGRRWRRDACFQALAGERPRRRWKQVHPLFDPAPVPGSHACDGIDQVPRNRGSVPTIWLHAASTGWALPQRRNRAWPRLTMALSVSRKCSCWATRCLGKLCLRPTRRVTDSVPWGFAHRGQARRAPVAGGKPRRPLALAGAPGSLPFPTPPPAVPSPTHPCHRCHPWPIPFCGWLSRVEPRKAPMAQIGKSSEPVIVTLPESERTWLWGSCVPSGGCGLGRCSGRPLPNRTTLRSAPSLSSRARCG